MSVSFWDWNLCYRKKNDRKGKKNPWLKQMSPQNLPCKYWLLTAEEITLPYCPHGHWVITTPKQWLGSFESPQMWRASGKVSSRMPRESKQWTLHVLLLPHCSQVLAGGSLGFICSSILLSGLSCCPQLPVLRRTPAGGKHLRVGPGQSLGRSYWYHVRDPKSPQYLQGCGTHSAYRETSLHTFFIFINQSLKKIPTYPCFLPSVTTKTTII